jgi:hypothetical protein
MACPYCNSESIIKKGVRHLKFETAQMYFCKSCGRYFSSKKIPQRMYAPSIIIATLNLYDQGYSLDKTRLKINKSFKVKLGKSTIHSWIRSYAEFCPIHYVRDQFLPGADVLFRKHFDHENLDYEFIYHSYKLETKVKNNFSKLYAYIKRFEKGCPKEFFEIGKRCSQPLFDVRVDVRRSKNLSCKLAEFSEAGVIGSMIWSLVRIEI